MKTIKVTTHTKKLLRTGDTVSCYIQGEFIPKATVFIHPKSEVIYLCQDKFGSTHLNRLVKQKFMHSIDRAAVQGLNGATRIKIIHREIEKVDDSKGNRVKIEVSKKKRTVNKVKSIPKTQLYHGQRIYCRIVGHKIMDAKISIRFPNIKSKHLGNGFIYICQNDIQNTGGYNVDKLGYSKCFYIGSSTSPGMNGARAIEEAPQIEEITTKDLFSEIISEKRIEDGLEEGDILRGPDSLKREVLGVCGKIVHLSKTFVGGQFNPVQYGSTQSLPELISRRFIIWKEPTTPTLTLEQLMEIAKKQVGTFKLAE